MAVVALPLGARRAAVALARRNATEVASRSGLSAMTMNTRTVAAADLYAQYIGETTNGLAPPRMVDMTLAGASNLRSPRNFFFLMFFKFYSFQLYFAEIMTLFTTGMLNLKPIGQRPMILNASQHLVRDMLFNNVRPPSMLYNRTEQGWYDAADGLQRSSKIAATLMGMLPIKQLDGTFVYLCSPDDQMFGWRTIRNKASTPLPVKESIDVMLASFRVDPDSEDPVTLADTSLLIKSNTIRVSVQVVEQWPAKSVACLAQLQSMNTTTHSLGETAYESTNALSAVMARHESVWLPHMISLGLGTFNKNKALFLHTLRGISCVIPEIEFVNKANDVVGFGDFMSSIFHFMMNDLPDGFEEDMIIKGFIARLEEFVMYKEMSNEDDNRIKRWKPDMIAALVYMLTLGSEMFPNDVVFDVLKRFECPRKNVDGNFVKWFKNGYSKMDNLILSFSHLLNQVATGEELQDVEKPKRRVRATVNGQAPSKRRKTQESNDSDDTDVE